MIGNGWWAWRHAVEVRRLAAQRQALVGTNARQRETIRTLRRRLQDNQHALASYAKAIGRMQAQLTRLEVLGSRLAKAAKVRLDTDDFSRAVGTGGPVRPEQPLTLPELEQALTKLDARLDRVDDALSTMSYLRGWDAEKQAARPHLWPTRGGWISSGFGPRIDPFEGGREFHPGVDIANRLGAPVLAASRGVVVFAGRMQGFGLMIDIDHGHGFLTRYGHMASIAVKVGDTVRAGQLIGRIGSRGRSTGPHLHFEVHYLGKALDPRRFLPRRHG